MRFGAVVLLSLACALSADRRPAPLRPEPPRPLFAGCGAVLAGGICELPRDGAIRVFASADATVSVDGVEAKTTPSRVLKHGTVHRVVVPAGARAVTVVDGPSRFLLPVAPPTTYAWLVEGRAIRSKEPAAARVLAERALSSPDPAERALALGLIARIELARGDVEQAIGHFREALALPSKRVSDRAEDAFALAFALNQRSRRYAEARAALDAIEPSLAEYPEGRARLPFYRAEIALETADDRATLRLLDRSLAAATELGLVRLERNALGLRAAVLQIQGHFDAGIATLQALDRDLSADASAEPCDHLDVLNNLGLSLERRARARRDLHEPFDESELSAVAARARALKCADPYRRSIALYVAATGALARGDTREATRLLTEARPAAVRTIDVLQWLDLEARIALAEERFGDAVAKYDQAIAIATVAAQTDRLWRAVVGRGEALEALGDPGARAAYEAAEEILDGKVFALPLGEGRSVYLSRSEKSARLLIDHLLRGNDAAAAFAVARRARARLLVQTARATSVSAMGPEARKRWDRAIAEYRATRTALDEAAASDWKLAASDLQKAGLARAATVSTMVAALDDAMSSLELPHARAALADPGPGELWVAFHRRREGYVAFAATSSAVTQFPLDVGGDVGKQLLDRLPLTGVRRVVMLPYGPLRALDLHALPGLQVPVEYALDVPYTRAPVDAPESVGIVADPTHDLPAAREEGRAIAELFTVGYAVRRAEGSDATAQMVAQLLESSETFHYAGHGAFGGPEGIEARLPLANGTALSILDVLTRTRVPRRVVLSACETGRAADASTETIGLAHAFVLAGSATVVAPTRVVPDALAAKVSVGYYQALLRGDDPGKALFVAQRALDPATDWAAWRLFRH